METEVGVAADDWHSGRVRDLARQFDSGELLSTPPLSVRPDRSTPIRRQKRIITKSSPPSVNGHKTARVFTSVNVGLSRKRSSLSKRSRSSHDSMVARRCQSQVNLSPPSAMSKSHSAHDRLMSTPAASPQHLDLPDFEPSPVFDDEGDETHPPYPLGERSYSSNILTIRLKPKTPPKPASLKAAFKCATLRPNFRPPPPPLAHRERKMAVGESHLDDDQKHLENGQNHVENGQANKENGWASTENERSTEHVRDVSPSGSSRGLLRDCLETLDRDTSFASDSSTLSPFLQHRRASDDYVAYDSEFSRRAPADSEEQRDDSSGSNIYQSLASSPVTETYPDLPPPPLPPRNGPSTNGTLFNPSQVPPQLPLSPPPVPPKAFSLQRDRSTTDATAASSNGDYEDIEQISAAIRRHTQSDGWETTSNMSSLALDTPADFEGQSASAVIFRQRSVSQESVNLKTVGRQPCASTSSAGCNGEKKKSKKLYRPQSTIDVDRLLRIKSDIQLNITKKVGQIKLKVTSATPVQSERTRGKSRYEKAKSMFYVESGLKTISHRDTSMVASIEFPLNTHGVGDDDDGEEGIYGDDWSSEDDDWASDREGEDEQTECGLDDQENVPSATGTLLPDVVPTFGDATATYASVSPRQSLHSNEGEDVPLPSNGVEEDEADLLSPLPPRQTSQETDENIDLSLQPLYMSRLSTMQPLYQIYMLQEAAIACSGRSVVDPPAVVPKATVQRQPSTASSDSGRGADCSTVSLSTCNTSMRTRERLVAASDFGSQRSLWCE
uniref:Uncharacterized protein n=1 Tax=Plectus sambesii TaxID=2011161 RepID=A0A914VKY6_9BILA